MVDATFAARTSASWVFVLFHNKPNKPHLLEDGRTIFESRSVAVLAMVVAYEEKSNEFFALVGQRGPAVVSSGLWNMVCGYLDWNESLGEALVREVWEEAGFDLRYFEKEGVTLPTQPVHVASTPRSGSQNVTARFLVSLPFRSFVHTRNAEKDEALDVEWMSISRAEINKKKWAFSHKELLRDQNSFLNGDRLDGSLGTWCIEHYGE